MWLGKHKVHAIISMDHSTHKWTLPRVTADWRKHLYTFHWSETGQFWERETYSFHNVSKSLLSAYYCNIQQWGEQLGQHPKPSGSASGGCKHHQRLVNLFFTYDTPSNKHQSFVCTTQNQHRQLQGQQWPCSAGFFFFCSWGIMVQSHVWISQMQRGSCESPLLAAAGCCL